MTKNTLFKIFLFSSILVLSGCSGVKETLGLTREVPDEFEVGSDKTLEMPPEESAMGSSKAKPQIKRIDLNQIIGAPRSQKKTTQSSLEKKFLSTLGATPDKNIRQTVNQESEQPLTKTQEIQQKAKDIIMFWKTDKKKPAKVIRAEDEKKRLEKHGVST